MSEPTICPYCERPIAQGDGVEIPKGGPWHAECIWKHCLSFEVIKGMRAARETKHDERSGP